MTYSPGQLLSLTELQCSVYRAVKEYGARRGRGPVFYELCAAMPDGRRPYLQLAVHRLLDRGYLRIASDGGMLALNPPHDQIVRDVCLQYGVTIDDIRGRSKTERMCRIRRDLTARLRKLKYTFVAIGEIIARERSVIAEFGRPEVRRRRARVRMERYYRRKFHSGNIQAPSVEGVSP
jgi:hypothetical protein